MKRLSALAALGLNLVSAVVFAPAAEANVDDRCFQLTRATKLNPGAIVAGLGLTTEQNRALRQRLATHPWTNAPSGQFGGAGAVIPKGLDGLGLTADQIRLINRRIAAQVAAMNRHPVGWPCAPFVNRQRVVKYVRQALIYNGFRPAITFSGSSPRQIRFGAIRDGIEYMGVLAKTGPRQIGINLSSWNPRGSSSKIFQLGFTV